MDKIRHRHPNTNTPNSPSYSKDEKKGPGNLIPTNEGKVPIINHPETLPISLSQPHSASFRKLTPESSDNAAKLFIKKDNSREKEQSPEAEGFWSKATASLWSCVSSCTAWAKGKLASGEVQQTSKILSAGRKFQAGTSHALSTQNLLNFTRSPKGHLDYGLSALSAAAGLYKFLSKHGKDSAKQAKMLERIEKTSKAFKEACNKLEGAEDAIRSRIQNLKSKALDDVSYSAELDNKEANLANLAEQIEITQQLLKEAIDRQDGTTEDDIEAIKIELDALHLEYQKAHADLHAFISEIDQELNENPPLNALEENQKRLQEDINRLDQDIKELLHESHELSKREHINTALLFTSGTKTAITTTKTTIDYGSSYCSMLNEHRKAVNGFLKNYAMLPVFITGLGVSAYSTYSLGYNYSQRREIEASAQSMLEKENLDPELEAFVSLVASRQRTNQTLLSFGSAAGKVAQNALALGVAFGGISIASAATGISEEILNTVITPVSWALGGAIACTSLGLKVYQNYQEANRKSEEAHWIQILNENATETPTDELSEAYIKLAEVVLEELDQHYNLQASDKNASTIERIEKNRAMIDTLIQNQAILNLMKLNVDFATGVIIARLSSPDESISIKTEAALGSLGIQHTDIEQLRSLSPELASNLLKEKLCLL